MDNSCNNSIYIYGKPGGGKTFIVNLFYKFIQKSKFKKSVLRVHFQEFMAKVHEAIYLNRKNKTFVTLFPLWLMEFAYRLGVMVFICLMNVLAFWFNPYSQPIKYFLNEF